jgi:hypothetical protein
MLKGIEFQLWNLFICAGKYGECPNAVYGDEQCNFRL